ncbi:hypothetical protein [Tessaracoccus coleopterorum]|uniref:hypothetical protein n=1 Tax=Tessaracoccus coleopterorum TaxID=2714950 RepID=UPI0018D28A4B|nr:hypothetical protein [Tessaracoccus coleopterorum]
MLTLRLPFTLPDFASASPGDFRAAISEAMATQLAALAALRDDDSPPPSPTCWAPGRTLRPISAAR